MEVKSYLKDHILLFDGAMGTYYAQQYPDDTAKCEWANIQHPERVMAIHNAYLNAGARAIKTNTFGANTRMLECTSEEVHDIICAGWSLACEAAAPFQAAVFADIGPLPEDESEYTAILDCFLALGAQNFLFETFASDAPVHDLAAYIKKRCPEAFIMASFAVTPDGFTRQGLSAHALMSRVRADVHIDATGFNCVSGPHHLLALARETMPDFDGQNKFFSVMPNAGYPTIVDGRTVFDGSPVYFASRCGDLAAAGVKILGGCCGTEPEHIAQTARVLKGEAVGKVSMLRKPNAKPMRNPDGLRNRLAQKLRSGKRVIAVELDPPADANIQKFMEGARQLKAAGVDAVTIADCPVARVRVDSSMLAAKLRRELDIDPIPHMTCRDRNINATKALLLGLSAEEVRNVLVVTGDPIPSAARDEVKGVFSFNSVVLADYIRQLSETGMAEPFTVCGALNVNARNFDAELRKALRKQEAGVSVFLTQPVFTEDAFEHLKQAHETLDAAILGGIIPIISHRNALFMSQEMAGIDIPPEIVAQYEGLERDSAETLAVELSVQLAQRMMPFTDGWYLITPFQRVRLIERILKSLDRM
jgi:methionine synthase I (cobalamin-dependent)/5,10-methylenetetrahydrofolate reductase